MKGKTREQLHVKNKRFLLARNSQLNVTKESYVNDKGHLKIMLGRGVPRFAASCFYKAVDSAL